MLTLFPVKVSLTEIKRNYQKNLDEYIEQALGHLGGDLSEIVRPGMTVLLKPDLMCNCPPEQGKTTNPELVASIGRLVKKCGGKVHIGDSPFIYHKNIESVWEKTGMAEIARKDNFELVNLEKAGACLKVVDTRGYYLSKSADEADLIINLPKLRTDPWCGFAGGIRNMLGVLPGFQKGILYLNNHYQKKIAQILVDIYSLVQPGLSIVDAISYDNTESAGFLLGSADAVAIDTVLAEVLNININKVYVIRYASDAGLGIGWLEGIDIVGETIDNIRINNLSRCHNNINKLISNITLMLNSSLNRVKPVIDEKLCTSCGICANVCPTHTLYINEEDNFPTFNHDLCVKCWSCLANCSNDAIHLEESPSIGKLFHPNRRYCVI